MLDRLLSAATPYLVWLALAGGLAVGVGATHVWYRGKVATLTGERDAARTALATVNAKVVALRKAGQKSQARSKAALDKTQARYASIEAQVQATRDALAARTFKDSPACPALDEVFTKWKSLKPP